MVQLRWNPDLSLRWFATLFVGVSLFSACALFLPHAYLLQKAFHSHVTWGSVLLWLLTAGMLLALIEAGSLVFNSFVTLDAAHRSLRWVSPSDGPFRQRRRPPAWDKVTVAALGFLCLLLEYSPSLRRLP
jgi:hypothetical protein